ncbi:hypothetical protein AM500_04120 [Bacillus sp. FJAT-18017]|uniref:DUF6232 family protein n=1 Tax=Bacillus sp. FJAT-18017 TaxID=1705566 RepID=UPI0006AF07CC|nr:DUF6232 family protein [Bacillus sp. FJAT-18017]ALC89067.1 hypothetical protein AM500_04120 [Bacillus sp. FJAT-18017]
MKEQIYLETKNIVISNQLIKTKDKLFPLQHVSSVSIGLTENKSAGIFLKIAVVFLFAWSLNQKSIIAVSVASIAVLFAIINWLSVENDRKEALHITLITGEKQYIFEDIDQAFDAVSRALANKGAAD